MLLIYFTTVCRFFRLSESWVIGDLLSCVMLWFRYWSLTKFGAPYLLLLDHPLCDFPLNSDESVLSLLLHFPTQKSTSSWKITDGVLRETAPFIVSSVTYMFNLSVSTNYFPLEWKIAPIIPIFKSVEPGKIQQTTVLFPYFWLLVNFGLPPESGPK